MLCIRHLFLILVNMLILNFDREIYIFNSVAKSFVSIHYKVNSRQLSFAPKSWRQFDVKGKAMSRVIRPHAGRLETFLIARATDHKIGASIHKRNISSLLQSILNISMKELLKLYK